MNRPQNSQNMKDFPFQRHKTPKFSACGGLFRKVILSLLKKNGAGGKFVYKKKSEKKTLVESTRFYRVWLVTNAICIVG